MTPCGVHDVVRRVEDPAVGEVLLDAGVGQLVVGGTADDRRGEHRHGVVVQGPAERAGSVDVETLHADQRLGVGDHGHGRVPVGDPPHGFLPHVGDHDSGALLQEVLHQVVPDLAHAA